jgi:hypothetical protein
MKKQIVYSEYKEILDIANRTNVENTYEELMKKEEKVLDTVNNVVKHYRDTDIKNGEFINQGIYSIITRYFDVYTEILDDFTKPDGKSFIDIVSKEDRPIYIGLTLIIIALILFFIENSTL